MGVGNSYDWGLDFSRLGVRNSYFFGVRFLTFWGLKILTFAG